MTGIHAMTLCQFRTCFRKVSRSEGSANARLGMTIMFPDFLTIKTSPSRSSIEAISRQLRVPEWRPVVVEKPSAFTRGERACILNMTCGQSAVSKHRRKPKTVPFNQVAGTSHDPLDETEKKTASATKIA